MLKPLKRFWTVVLLSLFVFSPSWAIDYTQLSTEELFEFRGAVQNAPESEQKAYQQEWQKRIDGMSEEDKKKYPAEEKRSERQDNVEGEAERAPFVQSTGYDKQGAGGVIFGGGDPAKDLR